MKITEDLLQKVFPNSPIREVAFEIRFAPLLRVQRDLADFQQRIVSDYPAYATEVLTLNGEQVQAWRFTSEDRSRTIRVSEKSFGFITNQYESFELYKSELFRRLESFTTVFDIKSIKRVGLRYINNILLRLKEESLPFTDYVIPVIDAKKMKAEEITQFACELRLRKKIGTLTIRTGLIEVPAEIAKRAEERGIYILDLDLYATGTLPLPSSELLEEFHKEIQVEFLTHIKEQYLSVMEMSK